MTRAIKLSKLVDPTKNVEFPVCIDDFKILEPPPEKALKNFKTMQKLGILSAEGILGLIAAAPIDPINLAGTLMTMMPDGWVFSAVDFTLMRVLSRDAKKQVEAALRVDLIGGDAIMALSRDKNGRLVEYRTLTIEPGKANQLDAVQTLCADTIAAARREAKI